MWIFSLLSTQFCCESKPALKIKSIKKISSAYLCGSISRFSILFHWSMCLSFHQNHTVLITIAICLNRMIPLTLFFFTNSFAYSRVFGFPYKICNKLVYVYKRQFWDIERNTILGELTPLRCWVIQSMNTVCLSIYLGLIWFPSPTFCNFHILKKIVTIWGHGC